MSDLPQNIQQWLEKLSQDGKSQHTIAAYRRGAQHFIHWNQVHFGSNFDPAAIIPRDIRDWKSYQLTIEKAAPSTVNQRLAALTSFFSWASEGQLISHNPTTPITSIQIDKRYPKGIPARDLRRLLRQIHKSQHRRDIAIIEVLLGTGIRVGELLDLQVGDIVLGERSGMLTIREGKQGSYRHIPLTREVRQALSNYLEEHPNEDDPDAPLWLTNRGPLTTRSTIRHLLNRYAEQAHLKITLSPHMLRHTFATRYLAANPDDLRGLAALLGHTSLDTVMLYTEPRTEDLVQRMERMELHHDLHEPDCSCASH